MANEIRVTPEELYFLGSMMNAKYIDYAYIAALDDISENYDLKEKEALASAAEKGILEEDFSGVTIKAEISQLLKPIFFGEKECEIDILLKNDAAEIDVKKYHFFDGNIVEVLEYDNDQFIVQTTDEVKINSSLEEISKDFSEEITVDEKEITFDNISMIITIKMADVEMSKSFVETMFLIENSLFAEDEEGKLYFISKNSFLDVAKRTMEV